VRAEEHLGANLGIGPPVSRQPVDRFAVAALGGLALAQQRAGAPLNPPPEFATAGLDQLGQPPHGDVQVGDVTGRGGLQNMPQRAANGAFPLGARRGQMSCPGRDETGEFPVVGPSTATSRLAGAGCGVSSLPAEVRLHGMARTDIGS